jgi:hypothetical protein
MRSGSPPPSKPDPILRAELDPVNKTVYLEPGQHHLGAYLAWLDKCLTWTFSQTREGFRHHRLPWLTNKWQMRLPIREAVVIL